MNFIGDYFAFSLVLVLCMFFFDGKHALNRTSKYFVSFLILTAVTAMTDIIAGGMMTSAAVPLWLNMGVNTLYFIENILTTSCIALYLFNKILEHSHDKHCLIYAKRGLGICLGVYMLFVLSNFYTGWMFYFDADGVYCRGPLNGLGYTVTIIQMALVSVCYFRNRKNASATMRRVLVQIFPVAVLCIIVQRMYPEIMLNSLIMSMVATVLFLTFNGQRPGVHALTRLNDRHSFFANIDAGIKAGEEFQILLINIKNFGVINQKYGNIAGDELLYQFAFSLEKLIKNSDAFHMNGTVFALVFPYSGRPAAERNRNALLDFLKAGIRFENENINLDYVVVEYLSAADGSNAGQIYELLEYAASKAYSSKLRHILCTPELGREMLRRRYLVSRMQHIDREHGFRTWYQPIRCMATGKFSSMEALVRILEPDGSVISPAEFIPIAEQTGMVAPITWFVLEESCRMLREHPELNDTSITINLPMTQMLDRSCHTLMNSITERYGVAHRRIGIEFTERAVLENFEQIQTVMEEFVNDGYRFYLDDFGAGYSNFNCLLQLPFSNIKLDMNLIRMDISHDGQQRLGLIKTLTGFLHDLSMVVIAEGIETPEEVSALSSIGADRIQGYIYARPMAEDALLDFYRAK